MLILKGVKWRKINSNLKKYSNFNFNFRAYETKGNIINQLNDNQHEQPTIRIVGSMIKHNTRELTLSISINAPKLNYKSDFKPSTYCDYYTTDQIDNTKLKIGNINIGKIDRKRDQNDFFWKDDNYIRLTPGEYKNLNHYT